MADGRRYKPNMQGLLKFCLEATKAEDTTTESQFTEMDLERKQWLQEALAHMTVDVVKLMKEYCIKLAKDEEHTPEERTDALEQLTDLCVDLDLAQDFHKIGGFALLPKLLDDASDEIRWRTGELIASLVQNNPYCQQAALQMDILPTLLKLIDSETVDMVRIKSLYATSCLCRNLPETEKAFIDLDGFSYLMRAMQSNIEKLQTKAVFLLMQFCRHNPALKDSLHSMGMVEQLITLLTSNHNKFHEHLLASLVAIATDHKKCAEECRRSELGLHSILETKIKLLKDNEEYMEEYEYSKQLMDLIFSEKSEGVSR